MVNATFFQADRIAFCFFFRDLCENKSECAFLYLSLLFFPLLYAGLGRHSLLEEDKRKKGKWRKIKMSGRERKERWKKKKNNKAEEEEKRKKGENRDEKNRVIDGKA